MNLYRSIKDRLAVPSPLVVLVVLATVKFTIWLFDHQPQLFLGDSQSYLQTAVTGNIPYGRSFLYGFLIRWLTLSYHSLDVLIATQVMVSAFSAWFLAEIIRQVGRNNGWCLWSFCAAISLLPVQLAYERFIMTECFSAFFFSIFLFLSMRYLIQPRVVWLGGLAVAAFMLVAFRVSFVPNVLGGMISLPLFALLPDILQRDSRSPKKNYGFSGLFVHGLAAMIFVGCALASYQWIYSAISGNPFGFHSRQGYFMLATVTPLLNEGDFKEESLRKAVLVTGGIDWSDPALRNMQLFNKQGLLPRMERFFGDTNKTDSVARQIAVQVIRNRPVAFLRLGWANAKSYLNRENLARLARGDLGVGVDYRTPLKNLLANNFGYMKPPISLPYPPVMYFFSRATAWYQFLVFISIPLTVVGILSAKGRTPFVRLAGVHLLVSLGVIIWLAPTGSVRYLHIVEPLTLLTAWLAFSPRRLR